MTLVASSPGLSSLKADPSKRVTRCNPWSSYCHNLVAFISHQTIMFKSTLAAICVAIGCFGAAEVPGTKAKAQTYCYYDQAYYVKHGCYEVARNEYGQIIQVCCR